MSTRRINFRRRKIKSVDVATRKVRTVTGLTGYERILHHKKLGEITQVTSSNKKKGAQFRGSVVISSGWQVLAQVSFKFIRTKARGKEIELRGLNVISDRQREGLFEQMLSEVSYIGRKEEAKAVTLEVEEFNDVARRAYKKLGFVEVGKTRKSSVHPWEIRIQLKL